MAVASAGWGPSGHWFKSSRPILQSRLGKRAPPLSKLAGPLPRPVRGAERRLLMSQMGQRLRLSPIPEEVIELTRLRKFARSQCFGRARADQNASVAFTLGDLRRTELTTRDVRALARVAVVAADVPAAVDHPAHGLDAEVVVAHCAVLGDLRRRAFDVEAVII
jgi:hypothetical protein